MGMNLVTAIIVEHAFSGAKDEEKELAAQVEQARAAELEELKQFFHTIDLDGSGKLTREELFDAAKHKTVRQKLRALDIMPRDMTELWEILDAGDGDGELDAEEFIDGIRRLRGEAKAKDILRVQRELSLLEGSVKEIEDHMHTSLDRIQTVQGQLQTARTD